MSNLCYKLKNLTHYNPQIITALAVFLAGPRTILRKSVIFSFNFLYILGKKAKKYKHRHDLMMNSNLNTKKWPVLECSPKNRIVVIIAELSIPQCKMYRVDNKKHLLEALGATVYIVDWHNQSDAITYLQMADFVIFYRVPYISLVEEYYKEADRLHLTKFYDIDDLIFDVPLYKKYLNQSKIRLSKSELNNLLKGASEYREAILHSDIFLTSTQSILSTYNAIPSHKKAYLLPNGFSSKLMQLHVKKDSERQQDYISIFYGAGSNTHDADFDMIHNAIAKILKKYKNVHLFVIGPLRLNPIFQKFPKQVHQISRLSAKNYFMEISKYDIALMPLTDTFFNNCKSNIKFIEASVLGIPSIASDRVEFNQVIHDGENGFLVQDDDDAWYRKIEKLVTDADLRRQFAKNAFQSCNNLYGVEAQCRALKRIFDDCGISLSQGDLSDINKVKLNILEVNLYYGLDSLGGATIVVENLATEMAKMTDRVQKVSVFTLHRNETAGLGTIRKYKFQGCAVYSCAADVDEFNDVDNQIINQSFKLVLETEKPDIVHFHAVQGFGYGIGKVCDSLGIPYVMTLHDCWTLCPRLFMVDNDGNHCINFGTSIDVCERRCHLNADWVATRRFQLYKLLKNAKKLYVPSFYAKKTMETLIPDFIYTVNKNGIENFKGKTQIEKTDRIRFLFVAGEAEVKGFDLMHQALMELLNYDWELILLMPSGLPKIKWPDHRVKVLGRQDRRQMQKLYNDVDVLLFPSLGYESFGLTVREAISSDCFVIVSECGGPTEAVVNGENGFIVPRGDKNALKHTIEKVLKEPKKYKNYKTKNYGDVRSYKEQAEEVLETYKMVMSKLYR
jgi:glycosyltransferase involved in cell wall biosynthesis